MMNDSMTTFQNRLQGLERNFSNRKSRMDGSEGKLQSFQADAENVNLLNNWAAALENRLNESQEFSGTLGILLNQTAVVQSCRIQILEQSFHQQENHVQEKTEALHDKIYDQLLKTQVLENLLLIQDFLFVQRFHNSQIALRKPLHIPIFERMRLRAVQKRKIAALPKRIIFADNLKAFSMFLFFSLGVAAGRFRCISDGMWRFPR